MAKVNGNKSQSQRQKSEAMTHRPTIVGRCRVTSADYASAECQCQRPHRSTMRRPSVRVREKEFDPENNFARLNFP